MERLSIRRFLNIYDLCNEIACKVKDLSVVCYLSAHFSIKWRFCKNEVSFTRSHFFYFFIICHNRNQLRRQSLFFIVKVAFSCNVLQGFILHAHRSTFNNTSPCAFLLLFHSSFKAFAVYCHTSFFSNFFGQFYWETIGVVQFKDIRS